MKMLDRLLQQSPHSAMLEREYDMILRRIKSRQEDTFIRWSIVESVRWRISHALANQSTLRQYEVY